MKNKKYIQYGCGWSAPINWRNFDASPTLRFERIPIIGRLYIKNKIRFPENVEFGDIVKGLPLDEDSCDAIYCSHVLEHLAFEELRIALDNTYKILKKTGVFRFVIPDLEHYIRSYLDDGSYMASFNFMESTMLGKQKRNRGVASFVQEWLGNSQHLWLWDYKSIQFELQKAGFVDIRRARFGDSAHDIFQDVEAFERWENCLGIECEK